MGWTSPATWVSGSILYAAQLNQQVRDNLNYLKGETDAFDAHAAAGAAVHQLAAGVYVAGFRGAAGKWMATGGTTVTCATDTGMNMDAPGQTDITFPTAYSSTPVVMTDVGDTSDKYGVTQAHHLTTSGCHVRAYRSAGTVDVTVNWFSIG